MPKENSEGSGSSQNTPAAQKSINPVGFGELDLARVLNGAFGEQANIVDRPDETPPDGGEDSGGTPDPDPNGDTPPNETEEALSQSLENSADNPDPQQPEEGETDAAQDEADQKRYSERTKARIEKLAKEAKEGREAIAKVGELEGRLAALESGGGRQEAAPDSNDPVGQIWDVDKLTAEFGKARDLKRWCEDNQEGAELNGKEYTAKDIKEIRRKVEDAMEVHIPRRAQYIQAYNAIRPEAVKLYPWLADRNSQEAAEFTQIKRMLPQITQMPEHEVLIGDFIAGRRARLEKMKASKSPVKQAPKPVQRQPGIPAAAATRQDAGAVQRRASQQKFLKTGNERDLAKSLHSLGVI